MEYPENWKERMTMWETTIQAMENVNKIQTEINEFSKIRRDNNNDNESVPELSIV